MLLIVFSVDFALHHAWVADTVAQANVDHRSTYLIAGRRVVHHFDAFDAVGRQRFQQGVQLRTAHVGHLAVQHDGNRLHAQRQRTVLLHHAGQFFQSFVYVIHRTVFDHPRQVVLQLTGRSLHDGTFAGHHHLGQMPVKAVHTGIARQDAVGRQRTCVFFFQILLGGERQSQQQAGCRCQ
ncbi:unknown [Bacteroides sp. CAG:633]|nr:unknown [Bacteroides sp. CAG:633]